jgi:hypothetical protein
MPAMTFEADVRRLQERCSRQGGGPEVVALLPLIFADGVNLKALTRPRTAEEVASQVFGKGPGRCTRAF